MAGKLSPNVDFQKRPLRTHPLEHGDGLPGEPDWVEDVVVEDALEEVVLVVGLEWRLPGHHLVHEHAQRPPVHRRAVVQLLQDLRQEQYASGREYVYTVFA